MSTFTYTGNLLDMLNNHKESKTNITVPLDDRGAPILSRLYELLNEMLDKGNYFNRDYPDINFNSFEKRFYPGNKSLNLSREKSTISRGVHIAGKNYAIVDNKLTESETKSEDDCKKKLIELLSRIYDNSKDEYHVDYKCRDLLVDILKYIDKLPKDLSSELFSCYKRMIYRESGRRCYEKDPDDEIDKLIAELESIVSNDIPKREFINNDDTTAKVSIARFGELFRMREQLLDIGTRMRKINVVSVLLSTNIKRVDNTIEQIEEMIIEDTVKFQKFILLSDSRIIDVKYYREYYNVYYNFIMSALDTEKYDIHELIANNDKLNQTLEIKEAQIELKQKISVIAAKTFNEYMRKLEDVKSTIDGIHAPKYKDYIEAYNTLRTYRKELIDLLWEKRVYFDTPTENVVDTLFEKYNLYIDIYDKLSKAYIVTDKEATQNKHTFLTLDKFLKDNIKDYDKNKSDLLFHDGVYKVIVFDDKLKHTSDLIKMSGFLRETSTWDLGDKNTLIHKMYDLAYRVINSSLDIHTIK